MAIQHIPAGEYDWKDFGVAGVNLRYTVFGHSSTSAPMRCGFYEFKAGDAIDFDYDYDEFKYIIDGEAKLDVRGDKIYHVKKGDCLLIEKGTFINYSTPSIFVMYYVSQQED